MADLSHLFGGVPLQPRQAGPFDLAGPKAAEFKRKIAIGEAKKFGLSPQTGDEFYRFMGQRLFELGDAEGAQIIEQERAEQLGAQQRANLEQNRFALDAARFGFDQQKEDTRAEEKQTDFRLRERGKAIEEDRVTMEKLRFNESVQNNELDRILKQQDIANGVIEHQIKGVELEQERAQLAETMRELEGIGIRWTPGNEQDKKTVITLNRGALAMRVMGTDLRGYTPSNKLMALIDQMRAEGGNPITDVWNQLKRRGGYSALSSEDRRFLMHALSISDLDLRPVSGAALSAAEVAGSIIKLLPMPGDDEQVRNEKLQARADVWKGLARTLPNEASGAYPEMDETALMTDEQLEAIANDSNP